MKVKTTTIPHVDKQRKPTQALLLARTNLDAFKAFDFEDDLEFCPIAHEEPFESVSSRSSTPNSINSSFSTTPERNDFFNRANVTPDMYLSPNLKFSHLSAATPLKERSANNSIHLNQYSPQKFYSVPTMNNYTTAAANANTNAANANAISQYGASVADHYQLRHASPQQLAAATSHQYQASRSSAANRYGANVAANANSNNNYLLAQAYGNKFNHNHNNNSMNKKRHDFMNANHHARSLAHTNQNFRGGRAY